MPILTSKRLSALLTMFIILISFVAPVYADPSFERIVLHKQGTTSEGGTSFSVTVSCGDDELLLGGGYTLSRVALDSGQVVSVEGNYPSGSRSWTVSGTNYSPADISRYVAAEAYCIKSSSARAHIIASPITRSQPDGDGRFFRADSEAFCPSGTILTGGGFRTSETVYASGIHNAWLSSFFPIENVDGEARGWRAAIDAIQWPEREQRPTLQTFAVCAERSIGPDPIRRGALIRGDVPNPTSYGYGELGPKTLRCPLGEVALGGGYSFGDSLTGHADLFVPHEITETHTYHRPDVILREVPSLAQSALRTETLNSGTSSTSSATTRRSTRPWRDRRPTFPTAPSRDKATRGDRPNPIADASESDDSPRFERDELEIGPSGDELAPEPNVLADFGGWTVTGVFGSQTRTQTLTGYAACVKLPTVRFQVKITSPNENFSIGPDFSAGLNGDETAPMQMTAIATDASGNIVPNLAYIWHLDGQIIGSGESVSRPIATQPCGVTPRVLKVVARDGVGRSSSEEVQIMVGRVC